MTIDGHNHDEIRQALRDANAEKKRPTLIIGKTIMGKGAIDADGNSMEANYHTHGQPLSKAGASFEGTVENLGGDPENPFKIFDDVAEYYEGVLDKKRAYVAEVKATEQSWAAENPEAAALLATYLSGDAPEIDLSTLEQKPGIATRNASSAALGVFAEEIGNMIVSSADLSNSDKTDGFLKKTTSFTRDMISAGLSCNLVLQSLQWQRLQTDSHFMEGLFAAVGTFFVFSDYMKPAVRLAALMELPVKYIWTHDAFRVGEDGPTHQPVEQEAQIRLLEKLKNHSGNMSLLALAPCRCRRNYCSMGNGIGKHQFSQQH